MIQYNDKDFFEKGFITILSEEFLWLYYYLRILFFKCNTVFNYLRSHSLKILLRVCKYKKTNYL